MSFAAMISGEEYLDGPELRALRDECADTLDRFNALAGSDHAGRAELLRALLGEVGDGVEVVPHFRCSYGINTRLGSGAFINAGAFLMDDGLITVGNDVRIGPSAVLATALHPVDDHKRRREGWERTAPITIGDNCWLGSSVTVGAGVTIGANTVVGAGSVVLRDLPNHVVAAGTPAVPIRSIPAR